MIIRIRLNIMKLITHFITFYRIMLRKEYHNYYIYIIYILYVIIIRKKYIWNIKIDLHYY